MEISKEQLNKLIELAGKTDEIDPENATEVDVSKALIEIERKLNFFDVNVDFKSENKLCLT